MDDYWIIFPSQIFGRLIQECVDHMVKRFFKEKSSNNYWLWDWLCIDPKYEEAAKNPKDAEETKDAKYQKVKKEMII